MATSCGSEAFELLGERRVRIEGVPRLSFAHHVDYLDAGQGDTPAASVDLKLSIGRTRRLMRR